MADSFKRFPIGCVVVALLAATLLPVSPCVAEQLYVAFWNVENLFDTVDDPKVEKDEEFTPPATKKWTPERFQKKLQQLARVITDMNAGQGPDVLGLSEVENRFVIERLIEQLTPLERDYGIVHQDSPSGRGIDCALIYDRKRLKLESSGFLFVHSRTREIVEAELSIDNDSMFVFVNHWPSRGGDREGKGRIQAAKVLRERIDAILAKDENADILVIGDLNDHATDPSVSKVLRTWGDPDALHPGVFFNSTWEMHADKKRGTVWRRGNWEVIDHIIMTPGLLDNEGYTWKRGSTTEIRKDYQLYKSDKHGGLPNRSYGRDKYYGGFSDHLPVACVLERN